MIEADCTYLVTGGAGFVGSNLVHALVGGGARVRVVDDFSTGRRENLEGVLGAIELIEGSLVDPEVCRRSVEGMDFILHQAAIPSVPRSVANPVATHHACTTATLHLLEAAGSSNVRRFIYAGSSSAYGESPTLPKREEMPSRPLSPYAVAKLAGENYCVAWNRMFGLETVALRYFNVFGPRQDPSSQYSAVIPLFVGCGLRNESPTIYGNGEQTRDLTHIDNVVAANLLACIAPASGCAGRVFNVGCGERISINRLWGEISELTGATAKPVYAAERAGDVRDSLASLDEIRSALGFEVVLGLREGLERTLAWYKVNTGPGGSLRT
jgi:UDP-N-acetylglucosamine/UDP-N-acetyl-alpha-D-glucosaminouronate 4-epimerase